MSTVRRRVTTHSLVGLLGLLLGPKAADILSQLLEVLSN